MFVFLLFSIGFKTDGPNQEKKTAELCPSISPASQTSLCALSGESCLLIDQSLIQSPSDYRRQGDCMSYPVENHLKVRVRKQPIKGDYQYLPFKSNQLRSRSLLLAPMFHSDQFKRRPVKSARLPYSGVLRRYQPY